MAKAGTGFTASKRVEGVHLVDRQRQARCVDKHALAITDQVAVSSAGREKRMAGCGGL